MGGTRAPHQAQGREPRRWMGHGHCSLGCKMGRVITSARWGPVQAGGVGAREPPHARVMTARTARPYQGLRAPHAPLPRLMPPPAGLRPPHHPRQPRAADPSLAHKTELAGRRPNRKRKHKDECVCACACVSANTRPSRAAARGKLINKAPSIIHGAPRGMRAAEQDGAGSGAS